MADDEKFYPPALRRGDAQYGEGYTKALFERINRIDPEFSMIFQRTVHGGLYDRDVIDHKTRELCAIAALCRAVCRSIPEVRMRAGRALVVFYHLPIRYTDAPGCTAPAW